VSATTYAALVKAGAPRLPDGWAYRIEQTSDGDVSWLHIKVAVVEVGRWRDTVIHSQEYEVRENGTIHRYWSWPSFDEDPNCRALRDAEPGTPEQNIAAACTAVVDYIRYRQKQKDAGEALTTGYRGLLGRHP